MTTPLLQPLRFLARIAWSSELSADNIFPLSAGIIFKSHRCCPVCRCHRWWVYDLKERGEARGIFSPHKTTPLVDQLGQIDDVVQLDECANCGTVVGR